jgi:hypothetical protein
VNPNSLIDAAICWSATVSFAHSTSRQLTQRLCARSSAPMSIRHSYLMTDSALTYVPIGRDFAGHGAVNHSIEEYVRGAFWHTNTIENYFSILKARDRRYVSPREPATPKALPRRVRLSLQPAPGARDKRC